MRRRITRGLLEPAARAFSPRQTSVAVRTSPGIGIVARRLPSSALIRPPSANTTWARLAARQRLRQPQRELGDARAHARGRIRATSVARRPFRRIVNLAVGSQPGVASSCAKCRLLAVVRDQVHAPSSGRCRRAQRSLPSCQQPSGPPSNASVKLLTGRSGFDGERVPRARNVLTSTGPSSRTPTGAGRITISPGSGLSRVVARGTPARAPARPAAASRSSRCPRASSPGRRSRPPARAGRPAAVPAEVRRRRAAAAITSARFSAASSGSN